MTDPNVLKESLKKALKCVSACASAAGLVNPLFSVAASLFKVAEKAVDDKYFKDLEHEFEQINKAVNVILDQKSQILLNIKKTEVAADYTNIEENLCSQFSSYMEIVKAKPEHLQRKKKDFIRRYESGKDDHNINNLYDSVVATPKVFSKPILTVSCYCSMRNMEVMKKLCMDLDYLFFIGCITMMTYYELKNDNMKNRVERWEENMKKVKKVMDQWK
ncbi:protein rapunzel-like isoform X1 [Triplophysa dalaica]|uniref:protein rapunzel-like isoform X1 n=1 Tax=Triplophysa dalaica TaxID=1582913 RepID=UPI0024DF4293|nr:protein rapunzel-like isoform X1 [Triplophysa dalaica]XP_056617760.1 protein rapunzel-like isoform X1 [Triplophysa dalaica]